jgi:hypothetical protein
MEWLANNWIMIALGIAIFALHGFMRGGHSHGGGHSRHGQRPDRRDPQPSREGAEPLAAAGATVHAGHSDAPSPEQGKQHRHGC